jgi:hypothetical protein
VSSLTPPKAGAGNRGISVLLVSAWATKAAYVNLVSPLVSPLASLASGQTAMGAVAGSMAVHCKTDMAPPELVRQRVALAPMPCGSVAGRFIVRSSNKFKEAVLTNDLLSHDCNSETITNQA